MKKTDLAAKLALDIVPDEVKVSYTDLKPKSTNFFHTRWQQFWNNKIHKLFQKKSYTGRIETSFQKVQKGTNHYILIVHSSHKIYALLYVERRGITIVYSTSNTLHH